MMTKEEYKDRINSHKLSVKVGIQRIIHELSNRAISHDDDKLEESVLSSFYEVSKKFEGCKFGSEEYKNALDELSPTLKSHYEKSPHHPEYYKNGICGMTLMDIIEMFVDWKSASSAYGDSFEESLSVTKERFGIDEQLFSILVNTGKKLGYVRSDLEHK